MVFSSPFFLSIFLPALIAVYLVSKSFRNATLLAFSLLFYTWGEPKALPVMLGVIILNYWVGLLLDNGKRKNFIIAAGIAANLLCLFVFKYLDFFIANLNAALNWLNVPGIQQPRLPLPLGISFYTFQAMSYIIDIYRGNARIQKNLPKFALYISLFPQLVAGPIVRYVTIANDLDRRALDYAHIYEGISRFIVGLGKKVFIADSMGLVVDGIFSTPVASVPCGWAWLGAIAYALQIYFDFSGYSDMAIGIGKMFNFHFPENFNFPYAARSIRDFWRRWHMSLTTWLKDYLYIPLGGSRVSTFKTYRNILIVLAACGFWHGASWNFLVWGLYNGCGLILERIYANLFRGEEGAAGKIREYARWLLTLLFVLIGWVIFRANDMSHAFAYLGIMFTGNSASSFWSIPMEWLKFITISNCIFLLTGLVLSQPIKCLSVAALRNSLVGQVWLLALFLAAYAFVLTGNYSPFLYFRF